MLGVAGLERHRHDARVDLGLGGLAFVGDVQNVGAVFGNAGEQLGQVAGLVRQFGRDLDNAAGLLQALGDDAGKGGDVDIAARDNGHGLERGVNLAEEEGGNTGGSGALGNGLLAFQQGHDRCRDLVLGNRDDVVHIFLHDAEGQVAGRQNMDAVGDGGAVLDGGDLAGAVGHKHGRHGRRLHADDLDIGTHGLDGNGNAANKTAAADGDDDLLDIGELLKNLEADGPLAGDDIGVIEGVGKGVALFPGQALGFAGGIVIDARYQNDIGAVAARGLHLQDRRALRHADHRTDAELGRRERHALGVVAGRAGDDPVTGLLRREIADLVVGTADFERAGLLQVLGLDEEVFAEAGRGDHGCLLGDVLQRLAGIPDHLQGN